MHNKNSGNKDENKIIVVEKIRIRVVNGYD